MRFYKAVITKVNHDLGYAFAKTNTKRHEVFIEIPIEVTKYFKAGDSIKVKYIETERGYLCKDYIK